jgi:hypothetical protein
VAHSDSDLGGQLRLLLLEAARGEPSEKPDDFAEMIEKLWCAKQSPERHRAR